MAEAVLLTQVETFYPGVDDVVLEATDAETWRSRRLAYVDAAYVTANVDDDGETNAVVTSNNLVTLNLAGMTDKKIALHMVGRH